MALSMPTSLDMDVASSFDEDTTDGGGDVGLGPFFDMTTAEFITVTTTDFTAIDPS